MATADDGRDEHAAAVEGRIVAVFMFCVAAVPAYPSGAGHPLLSDAYPSGIFDDQGVRLFAYGTSAVGLVSDAEKDQECHDAHYKDGEAAHAVVFVSALFEFALEGGVTHDVAFNGFDAFVDTFVPVTFLKGGEEYEVLHSSADGIRQGAFQSSTCEDLERTVFCTADDDEAGLLFFAADAIFSSERHTEFIGVVSLDALDHDDN